MVITNENQVEDLRVVRPYRIDYPKRGSMSKRLMVGNVPPDTAWVVIAGGNHSQFGWYGFQSGDEPATISREDKTHQVVEATIALLMSFGK